MVDYREWFSVLFRALTDRQFPEQVRERFGIQPEIGDPTEPYVLPLPSAGTVFDYKFIKEGRGRWQPWLDDLKDVPPIPRDVPVNQIIVSTVETVRYFHLFHYLVRHHKPVLLVGPTGTGKSVYIMEFLLKRTDPQVFKPLFVMFSAQTTANQTQDIIMSKLDRRRKGLRRSLSLSVWKCFIVIASCGKTIEFGFRTCNLTLSYPDEVETECSRNIGIKSLRAMRNKSENQTLDCDKPRKPQISRFLLLF